MNTNHGVRSAILIKYGEIALRGANRKLHEDTLLSVIKKRCEDFCGHEVSAKKDQGRFVVLMNTDTATEPLARHIADIFGVTHVCPCLVADNKEFDGIKALSLEHMRKVHPHGGTFKVDASRADKTYPLTSQEIGANIGAHLLDNTSNLTVKMKAPEINLSVEVRSRVYIYSQTIKGAGGLPSGTGGKAVLLLSGGFDSPVAGYMIARRGVELSCVYFHSPPHTSERAKDKAVDLARRLAAYTGKIRLHVANFTDVQMYLYDKVPEVKLTVFLKRAMLKAAALIADNEKAQALITGDSVGQVASQTMHALQAVDSAADYPVLRPLAAMDKVDIINIAERIGTKDISIRPFADCCTLFVPKHPDTKPKKSVIENMEKRYTELDALISTCVETAEVIEL